MRKLQDGRLLLAVIDGLGHGSRAAEATAEFCRLFAQAEVASPEEVIRYAHERMRHTVGAAGIVANIDPHAKRVTYAGVGNISFWHLQREDASRKSSSYGIIGYHHLRLQEKSFFWEEGDRLLLYTDGISTGREKVPWLPLEPSEYSISLLKQFSNNRDDALVLVCSLAIDQEWQGIEEHRL